MARRALRSQGPTDPDLPPVRSSGTWAQRRVRAFELLGRETIPAIVAKSGKLREISLIENLQRRDLHPLDTAEAIAGMKSEFGWTDEQIAKAISTSRVTVTEWLALTTLPESIRTECRALDIPKTSLVAIARVTDPEEQAKLWEEIKAGKVVTTGGARGRQRGGDAPTEPVEVPPELEPIARVIALGEGMLKKIRKIQVLPLSVSEKADNNEKHRVEVLRAQQDEKLKELRDLHKSIGSAITRIEKGEEPDAGKKSTKRATSKRRPGASPTRRKRGRLQKNPPADNQPGA